MLKNQVYDTSDATSVPTSEPDVENELPGPSAEGAAPPIIERTPIQLTVARNQDLHDPLDVEYWDEVAKETEALRLSPDLIVLLEMQIQDRGYAGDVRPVVLAYLAITSRLLERPMNLNISGVSSAGKNSTADAAVAFHPIKAVYTVSAASPMAMAYTKEPLQHRTVYFKEADSIHDDGSAGSVIRSLAADSKLTYSVADRINPVTRERETRDIKKPGPTGLMTTYTKPLAPQLATRMLEIPLVDSPEHNRAVMRAQVATVNRQVSDTAYLETERLEWVSMQEYLVARGNWNVYVPFGDVLANLIPPGAARMKRDFVQLLTCIQTIALLFQWQRDPMPDGRVVATLDDYRQARDLLAPIFDTVAAEGVTTALRQTVEAVRPNDRISITELAARLGRSKSTVSVNVNQAILGGWLINEQQKSGTPFLLFRGEPLPDAIISLPTVEAVQAELDRQEAERTAAAQRAAERVLAFRKRSV